ncbi:MAG: LTA synthase family protein [Bacteroidota bacterium]
MLRVFEYVTVASKSFTRSSWRFELLGLVYDTWFWLIWCVILFLPLWLLHRSKEKAASIVFHVLNVLLLMCFLGLLITFSERNSPFDHELFTRNAKDTIDTVKQMLAGGIKPYIPFIIYLPVYFILYNGVTKKIRVSKKPFLLLSCVSILALCFLPFANPSPNWFKQNSAYYLTVNKFSYWVQDSYRFLSGKNKKPDINLPEEIAFYHDNQPFHFTSSQYPLLHRNDDADVLGSFFNLKPSPPNIVLLVVEGLSRDFSGANAYAGSFTPFLDSLSNKSLTWDNFVSTAPGTFAAHPAITGSLPYGKRGFSVINVMPDHLSLVKILRNNGYYSRFLVGFNPDFDNMGGYIRAQGTDFVLWKYPSKYKEMGIGKEGWGMGYPDDALYNRSFEVMDSVPRYPYFNMYHTGTTHMPYLFDQKAEYEKKFDQKLTTMKVSAGIKRTLKETKEVLVTFMFSDDCIRKFFSDYSKRPEYGNTIFIITGDHHIGSFPATSEIDDYHVPLIIYSPMLKQGQKFMSVNSHNNIAPTFAAFLSKNFHFKNEPQEVHWMGEVLDTAKAFRNIHSMPFMSWSREITDYIYKDYFISGEQLYKLKPDLSQEKINNDTLLQYITRLRENFKVINNYVCDSNRIYPKKRDLLPGKQLLIDDYVDSTTRHIYTKLNDTSVMPLYKIPPAYRYLYVEFTAEVNIQGENFDDYPTLRFAMIDTKNKGMKFLYWSKRDLATLSQSDFIPKQWNAISATDLFTMSDYNKVKDLHLDMALYNEPWPVDLLLRKMRVRVYGIR